MSDLIDYPYLQHGFIQPGDNNTKPSPKYYELAHYLMDKRGFKTIGKYNWIYDKTHYVQIADEMLSRIIIELTQEKALPFWISSFFKTARHMAQIERDDFKTPEGLLNVVNGVVDIKRRVLMPHTDAFHFKYVTPIKFDVDAKCPNFKKYLDFVFDGDHELINVTSEIYGYCLLGGDPFLHKSFVLLGDGRNGKSTWLHVLRKLLGDVNCSSVSMGLLNKPFSAVSLDGKLANITGELPTGKIDSETFKTAVGGEFITAAHKGKDEYGLKCEARFVFACNDMPRFGDATTGMWEKLYMIPFNRYIKPDERDPGIFKRLESELSGILNFALDGVSVLLERGKLPKIRAVESLLSDYRSESDSVFEFFNSEIFIDDIARGERVLVKTMHHQYKIYCAENGISHPVETKQFVKRIKRILKEMGDASMNVIYKRGMNGYLFDNMRLRGIKGLRALT